MSREPSIQVTVKYSSLISAAGETQIIPCKTFLHAKAEEPNMGTLTMRIIPIGKVTSDLSAFDEMESRLEFAFDNIQ